MNGWNLTKYEVVVLSFAIYMVNWTGELVNRGSVLAAVLLELMLKVCIVGEKLLPLTM